MYFSGSGVEVSQAEAVTWIGMAAARDYDLRSTYYIGCPKPRTNSNPNSG